MVAGASTSAVSGFVADTTTVSEIDASFSVSEGAVTLLLPTTILGAVAGAKPTTVAVSSYVPGVTFENSYAPLTPDVANRRFEEPASDTVAPGTPAPCS